MSYVIVNLELELLFGGKEILEISIEKKNIYVNSAFSRKTWKRPFIFC